jgi:hypothetical protein
MGGVDKSQSSAFVEDSGGHSEVSALAGHTGTFTRSAPNALPDFPSAERNR